MTRLTRLEIELANRGKVLAKMAARRDTLAKLASPSLAAELTAYAVAMVLRKGGMVAPPPLDEVRKAVDALNDDLAELAKNTAALTAAMPAFRRWAIHGIDDPNGEHVPHPRFDPREPIRDYGTVQIAEKSVTLDEHGRRGPQIYTTFEMALSKHEKPRDLAAGAVDAALQHRRASRED
jgi:hypothetical protein